MFCFCCCYTYISFFICFYFLYILQLWIQPTHLHWNSTIKAHWDLYESTERAWFVSYSLCPFVPCSGKRWEGAEMIEELDLVLSFCACVRVCVLIEKTGFDMTTPHKDPWHTLTFNTHWLLSHTDPYHTESLIKQRPLLLPVRRHYLRPQLRNRNTSNIRTMMWSSGQHMQMCKVINKHTYNL